MVELIINGNQIELPKDVAIKYSKQISDIFDIANISCSYTNSLEFEKTPKNTQSMQQLGISGDGSQIPYIKNTAQLKVNGFDLVSKGWYMPGNTSDKYKGSVVNGMIDFFKAIENKTIGNDLDLSNFNHVKLISTVVNSFTNPYYKYIVADYGGKNVFFDGINIDYQAPSFSVRKLWELIFSTFGFNCDYTNLDYINDLYITYPKDVGEGQTNVLVATFSKNAYKTYLIENYSGTSQPTSKYFWDFTNIIQGELISNWKYKIPETTTYNFRLEIEMYITYFRIQVAPVLVDVAVSIFKNGIPIGNLLSDFQPSDTVGDLRELDFNFTCNKGDIIQVVIYAPSKIIFNGIDYKAYEWNHKSTVFNVSKTDLGSVILENEMKDFLIKDFFKEIIWRTGLTPIYNQETNTVEFKTLDSRIDFNLAQDLSKCMIERKEESYQNDYAQKNIFKLKRNSETEDTAGDGYLYVYNKNIEDEKTLAQSKIYSPDKSIVTQNFFDIQTNQYKIWQIEIKQNEDSETEISYKGLSGRFFFIRPQLDNRGGAGFSFTSEKLSGSQDVSQIYTAVNTNTLFEESVYNNYAEYQSIFINFRIHTMSLLLTESDFIGLDLTRPVYFAKENAYYICNKVTFEEGKESTGEFIKINKL